MVSILDQDLLFDRFQERPMDSTDLKGFIGVKHCNFLAVKSDRTADGPKCKCASSLSTLFYLLNSSTVSSSHISVLFISILLLGGFSNYEKFSSDRCRFTHFWYKEKGCSCETHNIKEKKNWI